MMLCPASVCKLIQRPCWSVTLSISLVSKTLEIFCCANVLCDLIVVQGDFCKLRFANCNLLLDDCSC
jgi:hypothetical protein